MTTLRIVLGDQLDRNSTIFHNADPEQDLFWMAEVPHEATKVWSHKARIALFLSAMRHFAEDIRARGFALTYHALGKHTHANFREALEATLREHKITRISAVKPGEWDVLQSLESLCCEHQIKLELLPDTHFLSDEAEFAAWSKGRKNWVLEHFYRFLRRKRDVLMEGDQPIGGRWNFDSENRKSFGKAGPGLIPDPAMFAPDTITQDVIALVEQQFPNHPGDLNTFRWPVTAAQAQQALADFIHNRLPLFGHYQDAMWTQQPWLYHARISAALNLKLLHPQTAIDAALDAYQQGHAPLAAVEGFVRQILGWREYVRHIYWARMPQMLDENALSATEPLPAFYWTGKTDWACLHDALEQTLAHGYAHHIQRLMVLGLFAQLVGVTPREVHEWFLAIYVDAVEWVEAPNTLGMSQYADAGTLGSKPYVASGKYIQRMSNYCANCAQDPAKATGEQACPFTTLYWDFLDRHGEKFSKHPRTALQWRSLERLSSDDLAAIRTQAATLRQQLAASSHSA
jgi:deoxyribodipyrimidine photolyase-related protein